jgi:hypothetical protein
MVPIHSSPTHLAPIEVMYCSAHVCLPGQPPHALALLHTSLAPRITQGTLLVPAEQTPCRTMRMAVEPCKGD